ncbi:MAG: amino acid permease [Selenomonadaceae bacterium]|nr:amino acid permease [Selenomonadaceae bacterium]
MRIKTVETPNSLVQYLTPLNVWALAIGCAVGWGAFVMPSTTFLPKAGPFGTAIAMVISAALMLIIAANYHYLINRRPDEGGVFTYTKKIFGYDHAFLCSWFLWFVYVDLLWANVTACTVIARNLFGNFFQVGFHYNFFSYEIYFGEIILMAAILICVGILCAKKRKLVTNLNTILALILIVGGLSCAAVAILSSGWHVENFEPLFVPEISPTIQIAGLIALAPWAFLGFESISNAAGEFNFSPKKSFAIMATAIFFATIFYIAMTCLAISSVPIGFQNWQEYVTHLDELDGLVALPTFYAANEILGNFGLILLGVSIVCGILTSAICSYFVASRLMYAMAKDNCLPKRLAVLNKENVPANAVTLVLIISLIVPLIGQTTLQWITDITTIGAVIAYGYVSAGTYFTARATGDKKFIITGAVGILLAIMFAVFLLAPNLLSDELLPRESYFILIVLSILGVIFFRMIFKRDTERRFGKSFVTWIVTLFMIFFCSLMWMRQSMTEDFSVVLKNITSYFTAELANYGLNPHIMHRLREEIYISEQMEQVRATIFTNSVVQIALIIFTLFMMFNVYSTMRKRERDAEEARIRAEENSRAKTYFLSNMSHDIRTPMNAIIGYTNLALRKDTSPAQMIEFLKKIDSSSQHLLALINDVLEMSRIESGKVELNEAPADLFQVLDDVRDMFAEQMESKNISFTVEFSNVRNHYVRCDKHRLDRVLLNLISNAYKFTPQGGKIEITLRELPSRNKNFGNYELSVKDSGIGMSEEFAAKIFEPFEREKTSTVDGVQGTGLGMAITKSIVDLMQGKISVITKQGEGTEFVVSLKFAIESAPPKVEMNFEVVDSSNVEDMEFVIQDSQGNLVRTPQVVPPTKKILLAEDLEVNREIALMILHEFGFEVEVAVNGKEAVEKISASKAGDFDAILMDIQMPVMNGYEATTAIRALKNKELAAIPIIAMTANAFSEDIEKSREAGMDAHIAKPLDVPSMIETLKKFIGEEKFNV